MSARTPAPSLPGVRVTTVILNVGDAAGLESTRRWYEDVLGLTVDTEIPGHSVWYRPGELVLGLHVGSPSDNAAGTCVGFEVDDVDELFQRLSGSGVQFDGEPVNKSWGARAVSTHDPVGHTITLATLSQPS